MADERTDRWKTAENGSAGLAESDEGEIEMGTRLMQPDDWRSDRPTQHISNVLGDTLSHRHRRREGACKCWTDLPHPACNFSAIGFFVLSMFLLGLLVYERRWQNSDIRAAPLDSQSDAQVSPEGRLQGDYSVTHDYRGRGRLASGLSGAVAADHGRCSDMGVGILRRGGTAVDAAVATALCQGIYNPQASGIGGGTFMLIRSPNGSAEVIDGREIAPAAASTHMFTGMDEDASLLGGLAIAAPLELKALWLAHQRHGVLPWADLVRPAAELARSGFPTHPYLINSLQDKQTSLLQFPGTREAFYIHDGGAWRVPRVNETCCARPALARVLEEVAVSGPAALDARAQSMAEEIQAAGGVLTAEDLISAQPVIRPTLQANVWGLKVVVAPPPSSGACLITALHILAGYDVPLGFEGGLGAHRSVEAMKHAFALRQNFGDPGACPASPQAPCFQNLTGLLDDMLSPEFAASLRNATSDTSVSPLEVYGGRWHVHAAPVEDHGTSHLSIVDAQRGAVAMTTTVNTAFGSKLISPSTGILFNNQMDDFSLPDRPNTYGVEPSPVNFIQPRRKPLSSMSPAMVLGPGGDLRLVLGASGGPRIISTILEVLLRRGPVAAEPGRALCRLVTRGDEPLAAVAAPRLHHQLLPNTVCAEEWTSGDLALHVSNQTVQALQSRGHNVTDATWSGVCQVVVVEPDTGIVSGVCDPRKDGAPCAY